MGVADGDVVADWVGETVPVPEPVPVPETDDVLV